MMLLEDLWGGGMWQIATGLLPTSHKKIETSVADLFIYFFNYRILPIFSEFGRSQIWDEIIASANILILDWWDT